MQAHEADAIPLEMLRSAQQRIAAVLTHAEATPYRNDRHHDLCRSGFKLDWLVGEGGLTDHSVGQRPRLADSAIIQRCRRHRSL